MFHPRARSGKFLAFPFPRAPASLLQHQLFRTHGAGTARYCLAVSFEVILGEVPIYTLIENEIQVEAEAEIQV